MGLTPELIRELEEMPSQLEQAIGSIPSAALGWKPASWGGSPGEGFSAREHVCHLRDIEADGYQVRIRRVLEEENPSLLSIDGFELAKERRYCEADLVAALTAFRDARLKTVEMVRSLSDAQLARPGTFAEYGGVNVRALLHYLSSHDLQHLACLRWLAGKWASQNV